LNKVLDADWRSGQFFENWAAVTSLHATYHHIASHLPHLVMAKLLAWSAICTEMVLAVAFAVRRMFPYAAWLAVGYHSTLMLTAGRTFGMFYFSLLASYLAIAAPWPATAGVVSVPERFRRLRLLDTERVFTWERGASLTSETADRRYTGVRALARVLRYAPPAYMLFWVVAALPQPDISHRVIALAVLASLAVIAVSWARDVRHDRVAVEAVQP
jgi:hypothetical protein